MNFDLDPVWTALAPYGKLVRELFQEHNFLTLFCGFLVVMMTISFYRFLKGINPALVGLVMLLMLAILIMHWTVTRSEPEFMKPFIDWLAPFLPTVDAPPPPPKKIRYQ